MECGACGAHTPVHRAAPCGPDRRPLRGDFAASSHRPPPILVLSALQLLPLPHPTLRVFASTHKPARISLSPPPTSQPAHKMLLRHTTQLVPGYNQARTGGTGAKLVRPARARDRAASFNCCQFRTSAQPATTWATTLSGCASVQRLDLSAHTAQCSSGRARDECKDKNSGISACIRDVETDWRVDECVLTRSTNSGISPNLSSRSPQTRVLRPVSHLT